MIAGIFLINGCTGLVNGIQPTIIPTPTLDPCQPVNFRMAVQPVSGFLVAFDDITFVANYTQQGQLAQPIMNLQSLRRQLDESILPVCLDTLKNSTHNYMNSVILYLSYFMGGVEKGNVDAAMKSSLELRAMVEGEYQKLIGTGSPSSQPFLPAGSAVQATPQIAATGSVEPIQVKNAGDQAVNIRQGADINSAVIGSLPAGEVLPGVGKDATGRWILVKTNTSYGWISAEMVQINPALELIPVLAITPTP